MQINTVSRIIHMIFCMLCTD